MKMKLHATQAQRQTLSFSLTQAINMLQMPQLELASYLLEEVEKNPLLDMDPPSISGGDISQVEAPPTLHDHLLMQIRERFPCPTDEEEALTLLNLLDEKGYLTETTDSPLLSILQTFDPPGVFARDLRECLLLQLPVNTLAYLAVKDHFQDILHGRFELIKKKMHLISIDEIIHALSKLNPRPAEKFQSEPVRHITADLLFSKTHTSWVIETKEDLLPKIFLKKDYLDILVTNPIEKTQFKEWNVSSKWLFRSLKRRKLLLLQIGAYLVQKQAAFLEQKGNLVPLTLQEISATLNLHESTLSRALSGKYAETPRGLIALKTLVTPSPVGTIAQQILLKLIANEDKKKPLSDGALVLELKNHGIEIARRTVTKYRKQLHISSAFRRKNQVSSRKSL